MAACACGMIRTVRQSVNTTTNKMTNSTISAASTADPLFDDERRGALDLRDLDVRARLDHLIVEERARAPDLAADLDAAAERVDALEQGRAPADERGRAGADRHRHAQVPLGDRPQEQHRG